MNNIRESNFTVVARELFDKNEHVEWNTVIATYFIVFTFCASILFPGISIMLNLLGMALDGRQRMVEEPKRRAMSVCQPLKLYRTRFKLF